MKWFLRIFSLLVLFGCSTTTDSYLQKIKFNNNWYFMIQENESDTTNYVTSFDASAWESVQLPHTPKIEPKIVNNQWQGISWYKKTFSLNHLYNNRKLFLRFEAAMNIAEVWVNGQKLKTHQGGYLPFVIDISDVVQFSEDNTITVRLNNKDNPVTGPKPLEVLDFNTYGGIYRNVWLITKNKLHITDPILENKTASGGVFVTYPKVTDSLALVQVNTHVRNEFEFNQEVTIKNTLFKGEEEILSVISDEVLMSSGSDRQNTSILKVPSPDLWSPDATNLYRLVTQVSVDGKVLDVEERKIGIKTMEFKGQDFYLNGKKIFLRGVNRHQEYPYVGYAITDNANYRDAKKIKDAGFNYVRLSHYPHSKSFMQACDELGLININAILGWQYFSEDKAFQKQVFQTARDLIRRDRNHASVLAWEVSLNESWMPEAFIDSLVNIAKEEYPTDQGLTAGWQSYGYDIYLQARQHRLQHYDASIVKPYNVSEYGDWEYYAMNAGLNQDSWGDLLQKDRSSRQLRGAGEKALLQQATNIQEAHNDNLNTPAFADGYWVMYDYNRGYADDLETSGIMDLFRLPKFSYHFYQSQLDANHPQGKPMVFIANYWKPDSDLNVRIFSNCEEVELFINGKSLGKRKPDSNRISSNLNHPPFTFSLDKFEEGELKAVGYINGNQVANHSINSPLDAEQLLIELDDYQQHFDDELFDIVFAYVIVADSNSTVIPDFKKALTLSASNGVEIIGGKTVNAEAGIASFLIKIPRETKEWTLTASANNLESITKQFSYEK